MEQVLLDRITANPEIFGGKPIIRGLRILVELILSLLAQGNLSKRFSTIIPSWKSTTSAPASPTPMP